MISGFSTYDNKTKTLGLSPGPTVLGTFLCQCTLHDIYTPSHTVAVQFSVKVDPPVPIIVTPKIPQIILNKTVKSIPVTAQIVSVSVTGVVRI